VDPDRIEAALAGLGPESRALVELSVIREVADDDIASLLGTEEASVRSRREDAVAQLATVLGADSADEVGTLVRDMRELPAVRWRHTDAEEPVPAPEPEPAPAPEPTPLVVQPGAKRRRRLLPLLLVGGLLIAGVALILALSGGDDEEAPATADEPAAAAAESAELEPVAGSTAKGTAKVENGTLELSLSGLPDPGQDGYVVWLYDSIADARPLNRARSESEFELRTKLPEGAEDYRFIDVSLQPAGDDRNHSGQSVVRVPLSELQ
jgi:hypothetical protein